MKPSRSTRLVAALIAVISLLFAQLALASYVCPDMVLPDRMATATTVAGMRDMAGCTGMDRHQPNLCHAHGHADQQSLDKPDVPQVAPFAATVPALLVLSHDVTASLPVMPPNFALLTRATAPPLTIRHCCFRI